MNDHPEESAESRLNPWFVARWCAAAGLLLLPLVAMQFTDEVDWTLSDFVFAAILIGATGLAFELALRVSTELLFRVATVVTLGTTFLLVWSNAAVGIIGSENNDANMLYGLVVAVVVVGAIIGRFRPRMMARATAAAAFVQGAITATAIVAGWGGTVTPPLKLLAINGFFIGLWLVATLLFRQAATTAVPDDRR